MKIIFEKWWDKGTKVFSITNYRKAWKKPRISFFENGGRKKKGNTCFDVQLIVGYTLFNYCNYNLTGKKQ